MKHRSVFYGTARKNLYGFIPLQRRFLNKDGEEAKVSTKAFDTDGIIFGRMATSPIDKIIYEELDPLKNSDVPILVSVQHIKLERPVQMVPRHIGDPKRAHYTGSPTYKKLSDKSALELLKDAIRANPSQKKELKAILDQCISLTIRGRA